MKYFFYLAAIFCYSNVINAQILELDKNSNLEKVKMITDSVSQEVIYKLKYNDFGQLIEQNNIRFVYDKNEKLVRKFLDFFEEMNSKRGWSESYFYDDLGNLIRKEKTTFLKGLTQIDMENYIYDACNNAIQISRRSIPEKKYPIVIIGGEIKNENDFYYYDYNSDCIWTKKYKFVNGQKELIFEREFVKL